MIERKPWDSRKRTCDSMFDAIGNTPLVRLNKIPAEVNADIYCKIEWYGPTGSLKDRIYYNMITEAVSRGDLKPGMTILECSTGNAGTACAWVATLLGYSCIITMPVGMSDERKKLMRAYGAELVFTPGGESDVDLALEKAFEIKATDPDKYWIPNQFDNHDNVMAHYITTGPEIWEQTGGKVDAIVMGSGTGGTISGVGRFLKERNPKVRMIVSDPGGSAIYSYVKEGKAEAEGSSIVEGVGIGRITDCFDREVIDDALRIGDQEAVNEAYRLLWDEGLFVGASAGLSVAGAVRWARQEGKGSTPS